MDCSGVADEARKRWLREITGYIATFSALSDTFKDIQPGALAFTVWLGLPASGSEYSPWGTVLAEMFHSLGFRVITNNSVLGPHVEARLKEVDLIVMLAVDKDVDVECIEYCPKHTAKMVVCYPKEHMERRAHATLNRHRVEIVHFDLASLAPPGTSKLGIELFSRVCDRLMTKLAEEARQLKLRESVILLIHGIMSHGRWQRTIKAQLKKSGFLVESTNSGWVGILSFFIPMSFLRNRPVAHVWRDIRATKTAYPNTKISVLAHSFGTFIVGKLFELEKDFKVDRLALCGSILPAAFPFDAYQDRYGVILNDVGCKDFLPALAASSTWGYGPTGTYGFNRPGILDRWHRELRHRGFFTHEFCDKYWVPFFIDGYVQDGDHDAADPPWWLLLFTWTPLKYVGLGLLGVYALYLFWPRFI